MDEYIVNDIETARAFLDSLEQEWEAEDFTEALRSISAVRECLGRLNEAAFEAALEKGIGAR